MTSTQVVETSVSTNNRHSQDYTNPDDQPTTNIDSPGSQPTTDLLRTTQTRTNNQPQTLPHSASDLSNYFKLNTLFIETFKNTWHFPCTRHYIYTNLHVLYGNFLLQSTFIAQHLTTTTTTTTTAIVFAFLSIKYIYNIEDMVLYFIFLYRLKSKEAGRENIALQRRRSPGFQ